MFNPDWKIAFGHVGLTPRRSPSQSNRADAEKGFT